MAVLYLTESEVRQVLTMEMAVEGVEAGLRKMALEEASNVPRSRCQTDHVMLHVLPAAAKTLGVIGFKAYTSSRVGVKFHVTLYDGKTGEMTAIIQADFLGQMRTGAASGVATKLLARKDSSTVGIFGAGKQARTQLLGVCKVRPIKKALVWSPKDERRQEFAIEMSELCKIEVIPVATAEEAARGQDIICTATSAREPFLKGDWLSAGQHLNIAGSNFLSKTEIDVEVVKRANLVCIDSKDQGKIEAGDFVKALDQHIIEWYDIVELGRLVAKRHPGRQSPEEITLFKSLGIGLEDIAVGGMVVARQGSRTRQMAGHRMRFFTIGYGGRTPADLISLLKNAGVKTLADVRLRPDKASMGSYAKAKTSDKGIEALLAKEGIGYVSLPELGNVFLGDPEWPALYRKLIDKAGDLLTRRLKDLPQPFCLMCAEKRVEECHRLIIAEHLMKTGSEVEHLE